MTIGLIFGKFAPLHLGHINMVIKASALVDTLHVVLSYDQKFNDTLEDSVSEPLTKANRHLALLETFKDFDNIIVSVIDESAVPGYPEGEVMFTNMLKKKTRTLHFDKVFTSEPSYDKYLKDNFPDSEHIVVDANRDEVTISATMIRDNPYKYWDFIAPAMRKHYVKKVCVIGVESCVDHLTEYFNGKEWKSIANYIAGDMVMQYNADGTSSLVSPTRYIKQPCDKMYLLSNGYNTWEQAYTEDHEIVYLTSKGNLGKKPFYEVAKHIKNKPHGFRGKLLTSFVYNGSLEIEYNALRLGVMICADGSKSRNKWRIRLLKERKIERARDLITKSGYVLDERVYKDGSHNFYLPLEAGFKNFPPSWYNLSIKCKMIVAQEVLLWDGSESNKTFYSTNKLNADFVQFCFCSLGNKTRVYTDTREGKPICYNVQLCKTTKFNTVDVNKLNEKFRQDMIKDHIPTDKMSYCFTVPSGMLVLRRKNHIFITGNCGKSTLVKKLSKALQTVFVEEVGRTICEQEYGLTEAYMKPEDYVYVAMKHKMKEKELLPYANKILLSDTNAVVTDFSMNTFNNLEHYSPLLSEICFAEKYDLVLYLRNDIPWVEDPLRKKSTQDDREKSQKVLDNFVYNVYKVYEKCPVIQIGGSYENRFNEAMKEIKKLIGS